MQCRKQAGFPRRLVLDLRRRTFLNRLSRLPENGTRGRGVRNSRIARSGLRKGAAAKTLPMNERWTGLKPDALGALSQRDYSAPGLPERMAGAGVEAGEICGARDPALTAAWIPGIEVFARKVFPQRHRGAFAE